jgi:hypothetical protein
MLPIYMKYYKDEAFFFYELRLLVLSTVIWWNLDLEMINKVKFDGIQKRQSQFGWNPIMKTLLNYN